MGGIVVVPCGRFLRKQLRAPAEVPEKARLVYKFGVPSWLEPREKHLEP